jgi:hypothetical protein
VDILTLELFGVTASQALRELGRVLDRDPGIPLRIVGEDETVLHNVQRLLERRFRPFRLVSSDVRAWRVDAEAKPTATVPEHPPPPVVVLRSAFTPGDRALGRRLLLGVLSRIRPGTPWVCLAHEALELLEDPAAQEILDGLQARGITVSVSEGSRAYHRLETAFQVLEDVVWQDLAAKGAVTVI